MAADPQEIIRRQQELASLRSPWESQWQEVAELVRPVEAQFFGVNTPGRRVNTNTFDSAAAVAADNLAAGLWGSITNSANEWFQLKHAEDELNDVEEVKAWLGDVSKKMRNAFQARGGMFYARVIELYQDLVTFGIGNFYNEERVGERRILFQRVAMAESFPAENAELEIDTMHRRFRYTARQARQRWGDRLSDRVRDAAEKTPSREFEFIHAVYPREDYNPRAALSPQGKRFASCWIEVEGAKLLHEGGYRMFPFQVPRWARASSGVYGYGPALLALADIKMLNSMSKTTIIAAQKAADPPILAPDEASVKGIRTSPGAIMYGGIDPATGNRMFQPFISGARVEISLEMENQRRQAIKDAFLFALLMMSGAPDRTATEVLQQKEEQVRLMGPYLGRLQTELLDPLIDNVFDVMFRAGAFAPPPDVLLQYPGIRVEYVSPLARAQKAAEGAAIMRTLEAIGPLATVKPEIFDNIDGDQTARTLADSFGMSSKLLVDPRKVEQIRQQRAQLQQAQLVAQAAAPARDAATALKTLSDVGAAQRQAAEPGAAA